MLLQMITQTELTMDKKLLELLACPICKGELLFSKAEKELICKIDKLAFPIQEGIPVMLENEARVLSIEEMDAL